LSFPLSLSLSSAPTTLKVNVPPQAMAGIDGNQGDRGPVTGAIDVGGIKDVVGGNTEGGNVTADCGSVPVPANVVWGKMLVPAVPVEVTPIPGGYNVAGGKVVVGCTASVLPGVWTIV
jgi:hypothetical protein